MKKRCVFSYDIFENYGSMSSPSVLFVLKNILDKGHPEPGQEGLLLSFGAGFAAFAVLVEFRENCQYRDFAFNQWKYLSENNAISPVKLEFLSRRLGFCMSKMF